MFWYNNFYKWGWVRFVMDGDKGDMAYMGVASCIRNNSRRDGNWMCFVDDEVVGRGTSLDGFVKIMAKDYKGLDFSIGRSVGLNGGVEIAVLYGSGIGDCWNQFECLKD
jgi:hypothetical protein